MILGFLRANGRARAGEIVEAVRDSWGSITYRSIMRRLVDLQATRQIAAIGRRYANTRTYEAR